MKSSNNRNVNKVISRPKQDTSEWDKYPNTHDLSAEHRFLTENYPAVYPQEESVSSFSPIPLSDRYWAREHVHQAADWRSSALVREFYASCHPNSLTQSLTSFYRPRQAQSPRRITDHLSFQRRARRFFPAVVCLPNNLPRLGYRNVSSNSFSNVSPPSF